MIRYRYALNSLGIVVTAESLAETEITDTYTCLSCEQPLIACVNGEIRQPYFRHKARVECNRETYLHRLAKEVFYKTYKECIFYGIPFMIEFHEQETCSMYSSLIHKSCNIGEKVYPYDLTDYYTEIKIENRDGQFIPDISLHSKTRLGDIVYIEIAVSHFLSEKKSLSSNRIIEIKIEKDEDIEEIRSAKISDKNASFKGFSPKVSTVPDYSCLCAKKMFFAFYVYTSGKSRLKHDVLRQIQRNVEKTDSEIIYVNVIQEVNINYLESNSYARGILFVKQVQLAQRRNVPIKNCYLCDNHALNERKFTNDHGIYCMRYKKTCNSNDATGCADYLVDKELILSSYDDISVI